MKPHVLPITFALLLALVGCSQSRRDTTAAVENESARAEDALKNQTSEVERQTNSELDMWDAKIKNLEDRRDSIKTNAVKDKWKTGLTELKDKRDVVKNRLGDVKSAGADTWSKANNDLQAAKDDLKSSYNSFIEKLGSTVSPPLQQ